MTKYKNYKGVHKDFVQSIGSIRVSDDEVSIISESPKKTLMQKLGFKKVKLNISINRGEVKSVKRGKITFLY